MAIRGRLDELQGPEVLQFLTQSGRTGTLRLQNGRWSKFLAFENGRLVFAISQHTLPPLAEVLYQRGLVLTDRVQSELRFDDEVTRALEWRRSGDSSRASGAFSRTRLGRILIERGRIDADDLAAVTDPTRMPESVLEEVLVHAGALSRDAIAEIRGAAAPNTGLYLAVTETGALTHEQVVEAISYMPERSLARLLVFFGHVTNNEGSYCAEQLEALAGNSRSAFRIGEYLVASGKLSQRQLERALGQQLTRRGLLGTILIEQEILTREDIAEAEREVAALRMEFSPLRVLRERLIRECEFTVDAFTRARAMHLQFGKTLAQGLIDTERIAEADLRLMIGDILTMELSDLMLWEEGTYEFFEGFTLADALGDDGLDQIHNFTFECSALLLDAHYRVDELRRTSFRQLGPRSILESCLDECSGAEITPAERRLIERMDGRRTLAEVCAVLPGNLLSHCKRVSRLVDAGWVRPLTRGKAFANGKRCVVESDHGQAVEYFRHALLTPGDGPDAAEVQMWIQHARLLGSRSWLRRFTHKLVRSIRTLGDRPPVRSVIEWGHRQAWLSRPCQWLHSSWQTARSRWLRGSRRLALTLQDFMIQKGLARHWWTVQRRLLHPAAGWGGRRAPRVLTAVVIVAMTSLALMIPGVADVTQPVQTDSKDTFGALRSPIRKLRFDAPIEVAPAVTDTALYVVSREGKLISVPVSGGGKVASWEVQLGEYGDLLSTPTHFRDRLFVTNVRGSVHAITSDGRQLWSKTLPRVERIAPTLIVNSHMQAEGVVVAARETMLVLHPSDGRELYRLQCGNVIDARPVVAGDRVFLGSSDNHVYCSDWRSRQVLWDTEVDQDVLSLTMVDDALVVLVRGGSLVALRATDGSIIWHLKGDSNPVHAVRRVGDAQISLEMAEGGVQIHDAKTGELTKNVQPSQAGTAVRLLMADSTYFYFSDRGDIGQVDESGANLWSCQQSLRRITSLTLRKNTLIVTSGEGAIWMFSLKHGESRGVLSDE